MKHNTPGPWHNSLGSVRTKYLVYGQHQLIANVMQDADAHLITAAPEMLEALSPFAAQHDRIEREDGPNYPFMVLVPFEWLVQARAAIAKARGEES